MSAVLEQKTYAYGRDHEFTKEEFDTLMIEVRDAFDRDDDEAIDRLFPQLPMDADVAMAFASVYGKSFIIENGFDLTQANMKFGEGWIDELEG